MVKNLPDSRFARYGSDSKETACSIWRRDPESNRARRICNPASTPGAQYATEGGGHRLERLDGSKSLQLSKKLPDGYRPLRPMLALSLHAGCRPIRHSNDRPARAGFLSGRSARIPKKAIDK